jgi:acyl carrier protein
VEDRLNALLGRITAESGTSQVRSGSQIDPKAEFSQLGVNSVDLMEFVLRVEQEFGIDLLQDMNPDELPKTLEGWAELLQRRIAPSHPS